MSGLAQSLLSEVEYNGEKIKVVDILNTLHALHPDAFLTTSEAAIFLRTSVTKMERLRKDGGGPTYSQGGGLAAKGTNQSCLYAKGDLIAWLGGNKVSSVHEAAIRKGQMFATIFDLAERDAFYLDEDGNVESMVEENLLGTVVERIGAWDIQWLTPVEAASRRWTDLAKHQDFAASVQSVLSNALQAVSAGIEATDMSSVTAEAKPKEHQHKSVS